MKQTKPSIDPRHFQIAFQFAFLVFGMLQFGWDTYTIYATFIGVSLAAQWGFQKWKSQQFDFRSPLISALGLCLLLHTTSIGVAAFAAVVAIASKYVLKFNGRHIFNPSGLGIVVAIALGHNAWISPGQWGTTIVGVFAVCVLGCIVVSKVQRLGTTLAFLFSFGGLMAIYQLAYLGWPLDFFLQTISTGSLLIFSFFMITDPRTTPKNNVANIVWAAMVGAVSFYFVAFQFNSLAPIYVLILSQPLVPLFDWVALSIKEKSFSSIKIQTTFLTKKIATS